MFKYNESLRKFNQIKQTVVQGLPHLTISSFSVQKDPEIPSFAITLNITRLIIFFQFLIRPASVRDFLYR